MTIEEGKKAPTFSLLGSDGKKHNLKDYAGQTVILYFYPKDDTPGCTKEACSFKSLHKKIEKNNAVVLGVSKDSVDSHNAFIEKFKLPFILLSDPDGKVMEKYGAWGEKNMYGKKTVGVIRSTTIIGTDGKVAKHWKKVPKAETHPEKVLEWLESN
ncbi:MAG: thioredoxin-dependent thiol peroxidase [Bdellovibrionales bacterium]|nr:thioredoxin-dependent thiol peroxidase [Bdellovibrionales bacterium]